MSTQVTILGNTGRDVELRQTPQGTFVANFSIASNTVRQTPEGNKKKTDWFNVTAFGRQAETLAKHLPKGSSILVRGRLTFNPWLSREGEPRVSADITLQDFDFAGSLGVNGKTGDKETSEKTETKASDKAENMSAKVAAKSGDDEELEAIREALREDAASETDDEPFTGQY